MSKVFYDFEFIELPGSQSSRGYRSSVMAPISIGMVSETGDEYYAINRDAPWATIFADSWLMEHVVKPHLPILRIGSGAQRIDNMDRYVKPIDTIKKEAPKFLSRFPNLELWADYGAYDHVLLCSLFGRMIDLPEWMPMFTRDLQQDLDHYTGNTEQWPIQDPTTEHSAIGDARHELLVYNWAHQYDY